MQLCKMPHLIPLDHHFRSASDGSSESDEENNKAEGSQCGPRPGPHEYANQRDDCSSDESSEGDGMISHRCLPWGLYLQRFNPCLSAILLSNPVYLLFSGPKVDLSICYCTSGS